VDLVLAAIGAPDDSIVGSIVGELSLFLLFQFLVVDDRSAVAGTMIYMPSISFPARLQDNGEVMEHFPFREIRGTTCLIRLRRPRIGVITRQIGTRTCHIRDGKLTRTRNSLNSQFLMIVCPISSDLSPFCPQLYHHLRTRS